MDVEALITIITLAAAVLNIFLFFKLWGMCNNIGRMTRMLGKKWGISGEKEHDGDGRPTLRV